MDVRLATAADLDLVAPLFDAYRVFYEQPSDPAGARAFLGARMATGDSTILIAVDDELDALGFIQVYPLFSSTLMARLWLLNDLFVAPEARGTGVVDALMTAVEKHALAEGVELIELATAHTNTRAQAVYTRHGYVLDDVYRTYDKRLTPQSGDLASTPMRER